MSKVYTALVVDHHDPVRAGRVKVMIPAVYGEDKSVWAPSLIPPDAATAYNEGDIVEVILKDGDPQYPLVLGRRLPYDGNGVPDEFRGLNTGPYVDALKDKTEHEADNFDNIDHRKGHDHSKGEYWNPYTRGMFFPLGAKLFVSEEPGKQSINMYDRLGQYLKFEGDPADPKDPHDEERVGGSYTASDLDSGSEVGQTGWRAAMTLKGLHGNQFVMRVGNDEQEEYAELAAADTGGSHVGRLSMSNTKLDYNNTLLRQSGGFSQTFRQVATDSAPDENLSIIADELGNQIEVHSDPNNHYILVKHAKGQTVELLMNGDIVMTSIAKTEKVTVSDATGVTVDTLVGFTVNSDAKISLISKEGVDIGGGDEAVVITAAKASTINGSNIAVNSDTVVNPDTTNGTVSASGGV